MGNTSNKNDATVVNNEDYEARIKKLEEELKAQKGVIKEQEATIIAQNEELEKSKADSAKVDDTPQKEYVSEENYKMFSVKVPFNKALGDKVVMVNDLKYVVKRGVYVDVPEWVKEVLDHEEEMELADYNHQEKVNARLSMF